MKTIRKIAVQDDRIGHEQTWWWKTVQTDCDHPPTARVINGVTRADDPDAVEIYVAAGNG